jgi:hypothetical protein
MSPCAMGGGRGHQQRHPTKGKARDLGLGQGDQRDAAIVAKLPKS